MTTEPSVIFKGTKHVHPASLLSHICIELKAQHSDLDQNALIKLIRSSLPIILAMARSTDGDVELLMAKNGSMSLDIKGKLEHRQVKKIDYIV